MKEHIRDQEDENEDPGKRREDTERDSRPFGGNNYLCGSVETTDQRPLNSIITSGLHLVLTLFLVSPLNRRYMGETEGHQTVIETR